MNLQTLRYYERRGLLREPNRTLGGHRVYTLEAVTLLRVIKTAQQLGFTLAEIADLLPGRSHHHGQLPDIGLQARAAAKLVDVQQKIIDLEAIRDTLLEVVKTGCDDLVVCADHADCPLPFNEQFLGAARWSSDR